MEAAWLSPQAPSPPKIWDRALGGRLGERLGARSIPARVWEGLTVPGAAWQEGESSRGCSGCTSGLEPGQRMSSTARSGSGSASQRAFPAPLSPQTPLPPHGNPPFWTGKRKKKDKKRKKDLLGECQRSARGSWVGICT